MVTHVQLFDVARTAHFERALASGRGTKVLFSERRYDFDADLATAVGAQQVGAWGAFWYMLRHDVDVLEIAEPLVVRAAPRSLAAVAGVGVRSIGRKLRMVGRGRPRTDVVAYAIENLDPRETVATLPAHSRAKWHVKWMLTRMVWRRLDRLAFGTSASEQLYRKVFGDAGSRSRLVPALPAARSDVDLHGKRSQRVAFLGELVERKGFPLVLEAWPLLKDSVPSATLTILGKGAGSDQARVLASTGGDVEAQIDPVRERIFAVLASSKVLVLPSQPRPRWREQVGLPIVEALASGCLIVTTNETGLAEWLRTHGHYVIQIPSSARDLSHAIERALASPRTPADVVMDLPIIDGRLCADEWLVNGTEAG